VGDVGTVDEDLPPPDVALYLKGIPRPQDTFAVADLPSAPLVGLPDDELKAVGLKRQPASPCRSHGASRARGRGNPDARALLLFPGAGNAQHVTGQRRRVLVGVQHLVQDGHGHRRSVNLGLEALEGRGRERIPQDSIENAIQRLPRGAAEEADAVLRRPIHTQPRRLPHVVRHRDEGPIAPHGHHEIVGGIVEARSSRDLFDGHPPPIKCLLDGFQRPAMLVVTPIQGPHLLVSRQRER
jgi:hypothetical protein